MAKIKTHCEDCERLLGKPYMEVHEWLDMYAKKYNPFKYNEYHRQFLHNLPALEEKFQEWGHYRQMAAKIHVIRDFELYVCLEKPFDMYEIEDIDKLFDLLKNYKWFQVKWKYEEI